MLNHNIFDNIRTRVIVLSEGRIIMLPPLGAEDGWLLPGGGLERDESLFECARREVLEETGIDVDVHGVVFLREWVLPKYASLKAESLISPLHDPESRHDHGYCLEVYLYATTATPLPALRAEHATDETPQWVSLEAVLDLPLWPKHLKWLCRRLLAGEALTYIPAFLNDLESPWIELETDPFARPS